MNCCYCYGTKLAQLFAEFISSNHSQYEIIPVGANWTDNRDLLGFENIITKSYNSTPALNLILEAEENLEKPYFLILDEMNLSHVERYFSDFLSAMESEEPIPLFSKKSKDENNTQISDFYEIDGKKIYNNIKIPDNLFIIGTVNVDETTYMFSPKVLDRANVLEFKTEISYLDGKKQNHEFSNNEFLEKLVFKKEDISNFNFKDKYQTKENDIRKMKVDDLKKILGTDNAKIYDDLNNEIKKFHIILKDSGFDFGYRTINEILRYMAISWIYEGKETEWDKKRWERYFDAQIKQKILPKLHGSERELKETLENLRTLCAYGSCIKYGEESEDDFLKSLREKQEISIEKSKYNESAKKLDKMLKVLEQQKYVSFIN